MGDIWKRATPGDPMSGFPAELYNLMLDCVKDYARKRNGGAQGTPETDRDTKIFIKNVSGADRAQCSVVGIGTAAVVPKSSKAYFFGKAVFESASPTSGEPFAILQDPIPDTKYGQARASGWSFVKVNLTSTAHEYADAAGVYTSLLSQAGVGPARIWWTNTPASTQLDGGINDSVVTITVDTNTNWPDPATEGSYVITIDTEDMQVTAHPTSTTRTVVRGYNSTTPAAHADNAAVAFKSGVVWAAVLLTGASGGGGITSINGDTTAAQVFSVGTSGTDFAITDTGAGTLRWDLPSWSTTNRGVFTTGTQLGLGFKMLMQGDGGLSAWYVSEAAPFEGGSQNWSVGLYGPQHGIATPRGNLEFTAHSGSTANPGSYWTNVGVVLADPLSTAALGDSEREFLEITCRKRDGGFAVRVWDQAYVGQTTTANFTIPSQGATVSVTVSDTTGLTVGQKIAIANQKLLYGEVDTVTDGTHFVFLCEEIQRGAAGNTMNSGASLFSFLIYRGGSATIGGMTYYGGLFLSGTLTGATSIVTLGTVTTGAWTATPIAAAYIGSHASTHQSGGSDAIKLDDLAAPDDNTDLNASISAHGLLKKLSNVATEFMNGEGNWAAPSGVSDGDKGDISVSGSGATWTIDIVTAFTRTLLDDADAATARATLELAIGTNVQAWSADLDAVTGTNTGDQDATTTPYTPTTSADWNGDPTTVQEALDRIAAAVAGLLAAPIP